MNQSELVKEVDRISGNKHERWNCIYQYLTNKENEKLNHTKVYECQETLSWYIKIDGCDKFSIFPYGFFFADYFNQLNSLRSKETFITYEKRMRGSASSEKEVNPTFDKRFRFFLWNCDDFLNHSTCDKLSDEELEKMYDNYSWLWRMVKEDVDAIAHCLNYQKSNSAPARDVIDLYLYVRRLVVKIWRFQQESYCFNKMRDSSIANEDVERGIKGIEEDISYEYVEEIMYLMLRYMGHTTLIQEDDTRVFCKEYDVPNLLFLVAEDMMRFMLHQTTHTFIFCPECKNMFVTTHGNQKHCPSCRLIIRKKQRKNNTTRYRHKNITDYINNYRSDSDENGSKSFRDESNYYWKIVQGKNPKNVAAYSAKIKTEADYMAWLEKKYEEIKARK